MNERCKAIGYIRVSTKQQGASGLGLEAQQLAIDAWVKASGCKLLTTYKEVESGKLSDRPEMLKALAHARRAKAVLVVAKLDRLSRNARFLLGIVESGADVVFCDLPQIPLGPVGKFLITQMAAVAELERGLCCQRTQAVADLRRARGDKMGTNNLTRDGQARGALMGAATLKAKANEAYSDVIPIIMAMRKAKATQSAIAQRLNEEGHTTRGGRPWSQVHVKRILDRQPKPKPEGE